MSFFPHCLLEVQDLFTQDDCVPYTLLSQDSRTALHVKIGGLQGAHVAASRGAGTLCRVTAAHHLLSCLRSCRRNTRFVALRRNTAKRKNPYRDYCTVYTQETKQRASKRQFTGAGASLLTWRRYLPVCHRTAASLAIIFFSRLPGVQTNGWIPFKLTQCQGNIYRSINLLSAWSGISNSLMKVAGCLHEGLSWWAKVSGPRWCRIVQEELKSDFIHSR